PITINAVNVVGPASQSFTLYVSTAPTLHWVGSGAANGNLWSVAANWAENTAPANVYTLIFDTTTSGFSATTNGFNPSNDLTGLSSITVSINDVSSAGDFTLSGNYLDLSASGVSSSVSSGAGATMTAPLGLVADTAFNVATGSALTLSGSLSGP